MPKIISKKILSKIANAQNGQRRITGEHPYLRTQKLLPQRGRTIAVPNRPYESPSAMPQMNVMELPGGIRRIKRSFRN